MSHSLFWNKLQTFSDDLRLKTNGVKVLERIKEKESESSSSHIIHKTENKPKDQIVLKIEEIILDFFISLKNNSLPGFTLNKRGSGLNTVYSEEKGIEMVDNVTRHEISLQNELSLRRYTIIMECLTVIYKLLVSNKHSTKRDVYYSNVNLFQTQRVVDEAMSDISCMLGVPRYSLNILSSSKGSVYGCLKFNVNGKSISCDEGVQIPNHIEELQDITSDAKYIMVIEKEATFQRLVECHINETLGPCILLTGKGFPDINTRMLLRQLFDVLQIPTFALVDADPHGIEIMCIYKYGSFALSYEACKLTCPTLEWLGVHPKDIAFMSISEDVLIPLTSADRKKASDLLKRPYISQQPQYREQIELLLANGKKAEIECLDSISYSFMTDIYLPQKIRNGDWL